VYMRFTNLGLASEQAELSQNSCQSTKEGNASFCPCQFRADLSLSRNPLTDDTVTLVDFSRLWLWSLTTSLAFVKFTLTAFLPGSEIPSLGMS
jgi:hypothetical protein